MNIGFVTYIAAAFVVLLEIGLVVLLISRRENRSSGLYRSIVLFAVAVLLYCLLYFSFYFEDVLLHNYRVSLPLRIIDYFIDASIFFLWLRVMGRLMEQTPGTITGNIYRWSWIIGILRAAIGMTGTCFMDAYYGFPSPAAGTAFILAQSGAALLTVIVTGFYTFRLIRTDPGSLHRQYVAFVSAVLCLWNLIQVIVDSFLYSGKFISAWAEGIPDTTAASIFLVGLATFLFVFREDFSPLFYASQPQAAGAAAAPAATPDAGSETAAADLPDESDAGEDAFADSLELAAAQHGLTVRELDVLRLVYEGKNNPEIAEALFISRNTVKKHLQSIYEKVGVNSRMELVYVVNLTEKPKGNLK